ncbi:hypothetical protein IWZ03DRAFT_36632 [Phyllosticta citriasiana]|uniref:Uncharacterized protein n=1 Tax=Phyllosticta citriasiana TaxID=595635 RepID=A0ABR1L2Y9_9PEZI
MRILLSSTMLLFLQSQFQGRTYHDPSVQNAAKGASSSRPHKRMPLRLALRPALAIGADSYQDLSATVAQRKPRCSTIKTDAETVGGSRLQTLEGRAIAACLPYRLLSFKQNQVRLRLTYHSSSLNNLYRGSVIDSFVISVYLVRIETKAIKKGANVLTSEPVMI